MPAERKPRALLAWSSGKNSAWTLNVLCQQAEVEVVGLPTTSNAAFDRVAMHAVRRELVEAQARGAELPLFCRAVALAVCEFGLRTCDVTRVR